MRVISWFGTFHTPGNFGFGTLMVTKHYFMLRYENSTSYPLVGDDPEADRARVPVLEP